MCGVGTCPTQSWAQDELYSSCFCLKRVHCAFLLICVFRHTFEFHKSAVWMAIVTSTNPPLPFKKTQCFFPHLLASLGSPFREALNSLSVNRVFAATDVNSSNPHVIQRGLAGLSKRGKSCAKKGKSEKCLTGIALLNTKQSNSGAFSLTFSGQWYLRLIPFQSHLSGSI